MYVMSIVKVNFKVEAKGMSEGVRPVYLLSESSPNGNVQAHPGAVGSPGSSCRLGMGMWCLYIHASSTEDR